MLRFLSFCILLLLPLQSLASSYTVNIAVYQNIDTLNQRVAKLPVKLQKTIKVTHIAALYKARTLPTTDIKTLKRLLPLYKAEFPDAHIAKIKGKQSNGIYFQER